MTSDWRTRYESMIRAAQQAGQHALQYYPDCQADAFADKVIWKGDKSPVTIADREAEALLRSTLLEAFPGDGFLGEESGELAFNSADYATEEEAMHALRAFIHEIFEEVERDAASDPALDAPRQTGHQKGAELHSSAGLGKAGES